ncbi:kinesin heavy chain, putative [Perkinsus marinus ATCC 50983]|uniref:Kinesin heavy chain, putative n=1 Tax=Perkinsus marinus (strain ATCC 50983 / TXsc) TaxID=423536 RepID=C5L6A1_PERM5|nr:kinesin heavy chain, putative [Perkinsus marinus ATCC 50983]EER07728.1 kinesin heavy chain, putative [Perkinsus marinus ATCC 50983]|eukprot:XP_002775912.1 kinesin heavy chain, putative [Perkinsus marinus ATCC 50983]
MSEKRVRIRPISGSEERQAAIHHLKEKTCIQGFNTCLLAYGVVGTGKTYTLHGEQHEELLVHHHPKIGVYIENLTENACNSPQSAMDLLKFGHKMRSASNTNLNSHGSRSHTILRLRFEIEGRMTTALFVDLAGLEDSKHSEIGLTSSHSGRRLKELSFVNKSLFELANCIHSLSTNHHHTSQPVPFRNSKLTLLLSDCLMGNCKTHMLATISPAAVAYHSTVSTLRFASTVKGIKCKCTPVTKGNRNECLIKLAEEVADLKSQLACLKDDHPAAGLCIKVHSHSHLPTHSVGLQEVERSIRAVSTVRDKYRQEWSDAIKEASVHSDLRIGLLK